MNQEASYDTPPTAEPDLAEFAARWLDGHYAAQPTSGEQIAACLRAAADVFEKVGPIARVKLDVHASVFGDRAAERVDTVDELCHAVGQTPSWWRAGEGHQYGCSSEGRSGVSVVSHLTSDLYAELGIKAAVNRLPMDQVKERLRTWVEAGWPMVKLADGLAPDHLVLHVRTAEDVDMYTRRLTDAQPNIDHLYGADVYEVMGSHPDMPGWTIFVQRHEESAGDQMTALLIGDGYLSDPAERIAAVAAIAPEFVVPIELAEPVEVRGDLIAAVREQLEPSAPPAPARLDLESVPTRYSQERCEEILRNVERFRKVGECTSYIRSLPELAPNMVRVNVLGNIWEFALLDGREYAYVDYLGEWQMCEVQP